MRQTTVIHFRIAKARLTISGVVQVLLGFLTIPGVPTKIPNLQYEYTNPPKHPAQFIQVYLLHSLQHFPHNYRTSLSFYCLIGNLTPYTRTQPERAPSLWSATALSINRQWPTYCVGQLWWFTFKFLQHFTAHKQSSVEMKLEPLGWGYMCIKQSIPNAFFIRLRGTWSLRRRDEHIEARRK